VDTTKLTVNLIPKAVTAMEEAATLRSDSKTDTVNRALQAYAFFVRALADGNEIYLKDPDGNLHQVRLL